MKMEIWMNIELEFILQMLINILRHKVILMMKQNIKIKQFM
jgi:hypothetical protein